MLHLNTVQYIFLQAFQVKSYCDDHQVAAEKKRIDSLPRPGRSFRDDTSIPNKRSQQTGACWWRQNQQRSSAFTSFDFKSVLVVRLKDNILHKTNKNPNQSDRYVQYKSATIAT